MLVRLQWHHAVIICPVTVYGDLGTSPLYTYQAIVGSVGGHPSAQDALGMLLVLFGAQMKGAASIGRVFGPIMLLWFVAIAILGLSGIVRRPDVVAAIDPLHAVRFILAHGWRSFVVLGGVFLAITGGEALYADMGHFGRNPIRSSWYTVVLDDAVYFAAHDHAVRAKNPPRLAAWRRMLFAAMYRNAVRLPDHFDLPPEKFLEIGRQIEV
jgi:K+ transporter